MKTNNIKHNKYYNIKYEIIKCCTIKKVTSTLSHVFKYLQERTTHIVYWLRVSTL